MGIEIVKEPIHYAELTLSTLSCIFVAYIIKRLIFKDDFGIMIKLRKKVKLYFTVMMIYVSFVAMKDIIRMVLNETAKVTNLCETLGFIDISFNILFQYCGLCLCIETYFVVSKNTIRKTRSSNIRKYWYLVITVVLGGVELYVIETNGGYGENNKHCSFRGSIGNDPADGIDTKKPNLTQMYAYFIPQIFCFCAMICIQVFNAYYVVACRLRNTAGRSVVNHFKRQVILKLAGLPVIFILLQCSQITTRCLGDNAGDFTTFDDHLRRLSGFLVSVLFMYLNNRIRNEIKDIFYYWFSFCQKVVPQSTRTEFGYSNESNISPHILLANVYSSSSSDIEEA